MATVLHKYFIKGWLKFGNKYIMAQDRLNAGNRFYADFYKACIEDFRVPDLQRPHVDGGNAKGTPDFILDARARFNSAYKELNIEQADLIMRVICWDKPLKINSDNYIHNVEVAKEMLCRALDALFIHYWGEPKKPEMVKISGYVTDSAKEDFDKWMKKILA